MIPMLLKQAKRSPPMASVAGLCCRGGWTRGLIDKLLGEPDKLARNPHYATAAPMRLYASPDPRRPFFSKSFADCYSPSPAFDKLYFLRDGGPDKIQKQCSKLGRSPGLRDIQ